MSYELNFKQPFINQLRALPREQERLVQEKVYLLCDNPTPDGHLKLKYHQSRVSTTIFRLRCGDYRVLYTYGDRWVKVLWVDNRKDVFRRDYLLLDETPLPPEAYSDVDLTDIVAPPPLPQPVDVSPAREDLLPQPIDAGLLARLGVPEEYVAGLLACRTVDDLGKVPVPSEALRWTILDCVTEPDVRQIMQQPDYVIPTEHDLVRFKEGDLVEFLLKLSPEQERFVTWSIAAAGPTLVKGGPGSGKSTVALYRVRELLRALRAEGQSLPRILFTTYTNALITVSRQLLSSLLGDDAARVDVWTADKLAHEIAGVAKSAQPATMPDLRQVMHQAIRTATFQGNALQQHAQARAINALDLDYLIEEVNEVIEACQIRTLDTYLAARRPGRQVPLNPIQRQAIWQVREAYLAALAQAGRQTWQQIRARAEEIVRSNQGPEPYDAVIIDEAQDLNPSALRMLAGLCRSPGRLFVTADANQSIYSSGFRWDDVHEWLQFSGRTGVLRANYRSTEQIGEAAYSYLRNGALDVEPVERTYVTTDGIQPAVRAAHHRGEELDLLVRFLPVAARYCRLGIGSCAVLCPTERGGDAIARGLSERGLQATYMAGREVDLRYPGIKVMTLKSSKGLEFPIVALAGFLEVPFPVIRQGLSEEERDEVLAKERRTRFVAMTRAMRALLVITPASNPSPLLEGFESSCWNLG